MAACLHRFEQTRATLSYFGFTEIARAVAADPSGVRGRLQAGSADFTPLSLFQEST